MPKSKRKSSAPSAKAQTAHPAVADTPAPSPSPAPAPDKACRACACRLPARARFCSRCGDPQIDGLERPAPPPSLVTVPSVPKVPPVRASAASVFPTLAADRPIPLSLLQPGAAASSRMPEEAAPIPPEVAPPTSAHAQTKDPVPEAPQPQPQPKSQPVQQPASFSTEEPPRPLFDTDTEGRILALRAGREITGERLDRLMAGFRLKPQPKPKAPPAKKDGQGDQKAEKKADKKADKKTDKKAKGH